MGVNCGFAKLTIAQYNFCYRISWIAQRQDPMIAEHGEYREPYHLFRRMLHSSPDVEELQEKTLLRIMILGWTPFSIADEWLSARAFAQVANTNSRLLTILIPYERKNYGHIWTSHGKG
ncbi:hypothetical protein [Chitinophaga pinensis]|uniref:Uncharacterized protein n=1 Tax=Chitinophaga pinensis TaxID=79329 RepID=A0A5C6LQI4_9BACT|nr:hypothetical protein [Chitinophaga pinensis]TWV94690.1 hypothetical protein FEF09_25225 [Chitinophaga pinensis]